MVNGIPQVKAMFRRKARVVVAAARDQARKGGEEVSATMRYLAPRDDGQLLGSIRVEDASTVTSRRGPRGFIGVVVKAGDKSTVVRGARGVGFQNARLQEFGTRTRPASPYFYPSWRMNRRRVRAGITRAVRRAWVNG